MKGLPFALLHQEDFEKKANDHVEKKARANSGCSTSGDLTRTCSSTSGDRTPCASAGGSPSHSPAFRPLDSTDLSLQRSLTPEELAPSEDKNKVLVLGTCCLDAKELVERQILLEGEDIVLCGNILRRRFPLLRKKVLMLTNMPRLLVLNPSGCELLKQIPLRSDDTSLATRGPYDFQVRTLDEIYDCYDATIGADVWKNSVQAAREKVRHGRFF